MKKNARNVLMKQLENLHEKKPQQHIGTHSKNWRIWSRHLVNLILPRTSVVLNEVNTSIISQI